MTAPATIPTNDDPWLTVEQCAKRGLCHERTIRRMIKSGVLRHARVGASRHGHIRIRASWLDATLEARATPIEAA